MNTIHKYPLTIKGAMQFSQIEIQTLHGDIIHVGLDGSGWPCFWVQGDPHGAAIVRTFEIFGTGWPMNHEERLRHCGTWVQTPHVWHLYEHVS